MKRLVGNQFDEALIRNLTDVQEGSKKAKRIQLGRELIQELNIEPQSDEW